MESAPSKLTSFERRVLGLILDGTSPESLILQEQLAVAEVTDRSADGRGTWIDVPDYAPRLRPPRRLCLTNLTGEVRGQGRGAFQAFFLLHIYDGKLHLLEILGTGELPRNPRLASWSYGSRGRDGVILSG